MKAEIITGTLLAVIIGAAVGVFWTTAAHARHCGTTYVDKEIRYFDSRDGKYHIKEIRGLEDTCTRTSDYTIYDNQTNEYRHIEIENRLPPEEAQQQIRVIEDDLFILDIDREVNFSSDE